jgi:aspartate racemase
VKDAETLRGRPARSVVGVVGGMGPAASAYFCLRLAEAEKAAHDQDHLHVILDSDPSVPDRTAFLLGGSNDPVPALVTIATRLVKAGAELLVMPCNSASPFTDQVAAAVTVPVVDWAGEAARAVTDANPDAIAVGLLATDGTVRSGIYGQRLQSLGASVVLPDERSQRQISAVIYDIKAGSARPPHAVATVLAVVQDLAMHGAGAVLVGCTELSLLLATAEVTPPVPVTDALEAVVRRTITLAGGSVRDESRSDYCVARER